LFGGGFFDKGGEKKSTESLKLPFEGKRKNATELSLGSEFEAHSSIKSVTELTRDRASKNQVAALEKERRLMTRGGNLGRKKKKKRLVIVEKTSRGERKA